MKELLEEVLPNFVFKEKCIGLKEFAQKYNYTYQSAKANWKGIKKVQLEKFDRQLIKIPNTNPSQIYIYELPSEKNQDFPNEQWKPSSQKGILISNLGRIKLEKNNYYSWGITDSKGYKRYGNFNKDKTKNKQILIHREVLMAFNPIENMEQLYVDHINGVRDDNRLENLRWVTPEQNTYYKDQNQRELHFLLNQKIKEKGYDEIRNILENI